MRIESSQIRNFINGEFVEPIHSLVIPSEVEESLDISARSLL
jgi:diphthamide biosynthesis methyltransferase